MSNLAFCTFVLFFSYHLVPILGNMTRNASSWEDLFLSLQCICRWILLVFDQKRPSEDIYIYIYIDIYIYIIYISYIYISYIYIYICIYTIICVFYFFILYIGSKLATSEISAKTLLFTANFIAGSQTPL